MKLSKLVFIGSSLSGYLFFPSQMLFFLIKKFFALHGFEGSAFILWTNCLAHVLSRRNLACLLEGKRGRRLCIFMFFNFVCHIVLYWLVNMFLFYNSLRGTQWFFVESRIMGQLKGFGPSPILNRQLQINARSGMSMSRKPSPTLAERSET